MDMRPEGDKAVGGAGSPGGEGADAAGSVIAEGICCATAVAAAGASPQLVPISEVTSKTEATAVSAARNNSPRPGRRSAVMTVAYTRVTNLPGVAERSPILIRGPCA